MIYMIYDGVSCHIIYLTADPPYTHWISSIIAHPFGLSRVAQPFLGSKLSEKSLVIGLVLLDCFTHRGRRNEGGGERMCVVGM